jgi:hypothetical protein
VLKINRLYFSRKFYRNRKLTHKAINIPRETEETGNFPKLRQFVQVHCSATQNNTTGKPEKIAKTGNNRK